MAQNISDSEREKDREIDKDIQTGRDRDTARQRQILRQTDTYRQKSRQRQSEKYRPLRCAFNLLLYHEQVTRHLRQRETEMETYRHMACQKERKNHCVICCLAVSKVTLSIM